MVQPTDVEAGGANIPSLAVFLSWFESRERPFVFLSHQKDLMMLVLSRKPGESVVIRVGGEDVVITYNGRNGTAASIGIEAPKQFHILRGELLERLVANGDSK